jgi:hypothetical protein
MKKTIISMALLVLIGTPAAVAQSGKGNVRGHDHQWCRPAGSGRPSSAAGQRRANETSDVPNEKNQSSDPIMLNKKMKSICRGC